MLSSVAARLKQVRKSCGLSQHVFAQQLGVAVRSYRAYELNERALSEVTIGGLASLGVSINWLLNGKGEMRGPTTEDYQRMEVLVRYWESSSELLSANMRDAQAAVAEKLGEEEAENLFDVPGRINISDVHFPYATENRVPGVAEKGKNREI